MAKHTHDDLFEGTTMTFGEHIEELRVALFRSLAGVAVGCVIGFFVANSVVRFFQGPLEKAMVNYYLDRGLAELKLQYPEGVPYEVEQLVVRDGLVPDELLIETTRLLERVQTLFGASIDLPIKPYQFTVDDLATGRERDLAAQIVKGGAGKTASPQQRLWQELSEEQQSALRKIADGSGDVSAKERTQLIGILNQLAAKTDLYNSAEFKSLTGVDANAVTQLREQLADVKADQLASGENADRVMRLNKMLLVGLFPEELRPPRINMLALPTWRPAKVKFQVLNAQEAFMIWMKAALVSGLVISAPWVFVQIWNFVAAGLYPHEKNYVYLYMPISLALFLA